MLQIRDHGVADYTALLDMDDTDVGVLTDDDRACLDELGAYLVTTESWQLAVWLLHKHFEPADREIFVERATPEHQTIETTLVERSVLSPHGISATESVLIRRSTPMSAPSRPNTALGLAISPSKVDTVSQTGRES